MTDPADRAARTETVHAHDFRARNRLLPSVANDAPNLLYGQGSGAWALTLTPTWQKGIFFARPEASYVHAWHVVPGVGLGPDFNNKSQVRGLIEAGIIF